MVTPANDEPLPRRRSRCPAPPPARPACRPGQFPRVKNAKRTPLPASTLSRSWVGAEDSGGPLPEPPVFCWSAPGGAIIARSLHEKRVEDKCTFRSGWFLRLRRSRLPRPLPDHRQSAHRSGIRRRHGSAPNVDRFLALQSEMDQVRNEFSTAVSQHLAEVARPTGSHESHAAKVCPPGAAACTDGRWRQWPLPGLGHEMESRFREIRRADELGDASGLTPDYRLKVKKASQIHQDMLRDLQEMRVASTCNWAPSYATRAVISRAPATARPRVLKIRFPLIRPIRPPGPWMTPAPTPRPAAPRIPAEPYVPRPRPRPRPPPPPRCGSR